MSLMNINKPVNEDNYNGLPFY